MVWHDPEKIPSQAGFEPRIFRSRGGHLTTRPTRQLCLFTGYLTSQQQTNYIWKQICSDNLTCRHTDRSSRTNLLPCTASVYWHWAYQTQHRHIMPSVWQGSQWSTNFPATHTACNDLNHSLLHLRQMSETLGHHSGQETKKKKKKKKEIPVIQAISVTPLWSCNWQLKILFKTTGNTFHTCN